MKRRWMLLKNLKANHTTTVHVNKTLKTVKCKVNIKQILLNNSKQAAEDVTDGPSDASAELF